MAQRQRGDVGAGGGGVAQRLYDSGRRLCATRRILPEILQLTGRMTAVLQKTDIVVALAAFSASAGTPIWGDDTTVASAPAVYTGTLAFFLLP